MTCRWAVLHFAAVGKYRGGQKPWEKSDAQGRRLDPGHYTELNAMFYNADPGEFIKMRIEALSLMVCADEQLAPAFGVDRIVATPQPDAELLRRLPPSALWSLPTSRRVSVIYAWSR